MNVFAQNKLHTVVVILLIIIFATIPLYFFESGGFQFVDLIIILLSLVTFMSLDKDEVYTGIYASAPFIPYFSWCTIIESYYVIESISYKKHILNIILLIYTFYLLFFFPIVFKRILILHNGKLFIYGCLLVSCVTPWLFRSGGEEFRNALSFQNPNQLAYFSIIILFLLIILNNMINHKERLEQNSIKTMLYHYLSNIVIVSFVNIFVFKSISRAGIISVALLDIYLIFIIFKKHIMFAFFIVVPFLFFMFSAFVYLGINVKELPYNYLENVNKRFSEKNIKTDIFHRSMDLLKYTNVFSVMCGNSSSSLDSEEKRALGSSSKEVHNTILAVFNSYGVIGGILFLFGSVIFVIRLGRFPYKWLLIIPLLLYNLSHNGIRFRFIWIASAFFVVVCLIKYREKNGCFRKNDFIE